MLNTTDDSKEAKAWAKSLDFKLIVPQLIIKPIIHPLKIETGDLNSAIKNLAVRASVWASVWASVAASVADSVRASVGDSVRASVGDSVRASVADSVRASVADSVADSVAASVGSYFILDKWKYIRHEKGKYPFQSAVDLFEAGYVPSFDGKVWRLHAGSNANIMYEISDEELKRLQ